MARDLIYVDDEPENLIVFEAAFEDDFNVISASSGQEVLDLLERKSVPVIVSDQRMPEMTGVELFERVRQRFPATKRILLTGYTDPESMLRAINQGQVFHFVKKPWDRADLQAVLLHAFEAHDLEQANTALTDRLVVSERCALLGQTAARVTHEMGNQLCMLPLLELIEDRYAGHADLVKVAQFAKSTYERLNGLIQEVKNFMRFEQESATRRPVPLAAAVHELVSFLRFDKSVPANKLQVCAAEGIQAPGNKVKLQQVLVNLIKNAAYAIKDKPDGLIRITVDQEGQEALLQVSDNGCGMTPETLARLGEPFFTTKGQEGNGLGIDVSRKLITGHGGTLTCESVVGKGTTFTIRLPLAGNNTPLGASAMVGAGA